MNLKTLIDYDYELEKPKFIGGAKIKFSRVLPQFETNCTVDNHPKAQNRNERRNKIIWDFGSRLDSLDVTCSHENPDSPFRGTLDLVIHHLPLRSFRLKLAKKIRLYIVFVVSDIRINWSKYLTPENSNIRIKGKDIYDEEGQKIGKAIYKVREKPSSRLVGFSEFEF